jgi:hypothetical protein
MVFRRECCCFAVEIFTIKECESMIKKVKYNVLKAMGNTPHQNPFVIQCNDQDLESEAKALFHPSAYKDIFGRSKKSSLQEKQRLSVVKIKYGRRIIHRSFQARSIKGLDSNNVGLSPSACMELGVELDSVPEKVVVCKGCRFVFFWNHPNSATRVSFRIGLLSIFIGLICLIIAIESCCCV